MRGRIEIVDWNSEKKIVTFSTQIYKIDKENGEEEMAVDGTAVLKIPYIKVLTDPEVSPVEQTDLNTSEADALQKTDFRKFVQ